jgi:hypothetical protein
LLLYWLLLLEEYRVTFEYFLGKKQKNVVVDALFRLGIDSMKIQEETKGALTLLSGLENISISNIKLTNPMHTALIFKDQGLREKGLAQTHYSIQPIEGYDLLFYKGNFYIPQALRQIVMS